MSWSVLLTKLSEGMLVSVEIFVLTLVFSLPLGLIVTFGRMSKNALIRNITKLYISIMRGTPLMLQLMVVYFGPYYLFGITLPRSYRFLAVIIGFVLNYAAILRKYIGVVLSPYLLGNMKRRKCWDIVSPRPFLRLFCPKLLNGFYLL